MYVVKAVFLVGPFAAAVIDFELEIWRNKLRLNRAEVRSDDLCRRKLVSKVNSPYAGARPNV
jgi:hypothetical protein